MKQKIRGRFRLVGEEPAGAARTPGGGEADLSIEELDQQVRAYRRKMRLRTVIGIAVAVLFAVGIFLFINLQTYSSVRILDVYPAQDAGNSSYREFASGVLKYSRDGIALLDRRGDEVWNQSYQMQNPMVHVFGDSAVVADKDGNSMIVVDRDGLKGEIETTMPIEKAVVSSQGIVAAVLSGDGEPQIVCFDAAGNTLARIDTAMKGNGYPLDLSLSKDGELLLVSFMTVESGRTVTHICYYDFGEGGDAGENYEVLSETYEDMVAPAVFFMDGKTSAVVGHDRLLLYKGGETPALSSEIPLGKEIRSVCYSSSYIGLVLKNEGEPGYELCLYNKRGDQVMSEKFTGDYSNMKICGMQVILYDGAQCTVFGRTGIHKFEGEMESPILEMFPVFGVNKYIVMNADGMEVVRFVK